MRHWVHFVAGAVVLGVVAGASGCAGGRVSKRGPAADKRLQVETVASGLSRPWSLNFAPDGRLLFTLRDSGEIGALDPARGRIDTLARVADVRIEGEAGLLGMELDPQFAVNGFVYVCHSASDSKGDPINRVVRLTHSEGRLSAPKELVATPGGVLHNGCRLAARDGYLFVTMGEGWSPGRSQEISSLGGKILRIHTDGRIPADNPFSGSPVWTLGHRNPQGLAFDPSGKLWSTEHGPETDDELNLIEKGKNYGWPSCRGVSRCFSSKYTPAVKSYYPEETIAISDLVFYTGEAFPAWKGNAFFVTLKTARLYRVVLENDRVKEDEVLIEGDFGRLRDVTQGPDGFLYIATESEILRVRPAR